MASNQPPAYFRYLKARLQPFKRLSFWASVAGLLLVFVLAWEYWQNPQRFSAIRSQLTDLNDPTVEPTLSSDELAARLADIDSSSVLLEEFDSANAIPLATLSNPQDQEQGSSGSAVSPFTPQQAVGNSNLGSNSIPLPGAGAAQPKPISTNPFALAAQELLDAGPLPGNSLLTKSRNYETGSPATLGGASIDPTLGFNGLNSNTNRSAAPSSALQSALDRFSTSNPSVTAPEVQRPISVQSQTLPAPTYSGTPYPSVTNPGQPTYSPLTVPGAAGNNTYPITPPPLPNSYTPSAPAPVQPLGQPSSVATPGYNSTLVNPGFQPSQLSRPNFVTPNPSP